jgi:hypothetical protein
MASPCLVLADTLDVQKIGTGARVVHQVTLLFGGLTYIGHKTYPDMKAVTDDETVACGDETAGNFSPLRAHDESVTTSATQASLGYTFDGTARA